MTARILRGHFPDGGCGLRVSEPGYDVLSNPVDNERLIFNSDWPAVLPVHHKGTHVVGNNSASTFGFPALPYYPFFEVCVEANGAQPYSFMPAGSITGYENNFYYASTFASGVPIVPFLTVVCFNDGYMIRNYAGGALTIFVIVYRQLAFNL